MGKHLYMSQPDINIDCLPPFLCTVSLRHSLSLNIEVSPRDLSAFTLSAQITNTHGHFTVKHHGFHRAQDLNPDSQACMASTFLTVISQSQKSFLVVDCTKLQRSLILNQYAPTVWE